MIPQQLKPWLVMALIFVLGAGTGASLTIALRPRFIPPPAPQQMKNHMMERLTARLKLTPEQQARIQPILTDATNQLRDEMQHMSQIMEKATSQMLPILTPEQQEELKKMDLERERMFPGHMHRGRDGNGPRGEPNEGMPPSATPAPSPRN